MKPESNQRCPGCGSEMDPEVCWCGEYIKNHPMDHNPLPMGCECGKAKEDDWIMGGPFDSVRAELNAAAKEFMEGMASNE